MKHKIAVIGLISIGLLSSCNTYLSPAIAGNNLGYMSRPMVADSLHSITDISASYAGSSSPGRSVSYEMGILNFSRGHAYKFLNFAYGAFGYIGTANYNWQTDPADVTDVPNFRKNFGGFGLRSSIGFHDTSENGNTDFRFLNWENVFSTESGSYTDFRNNVYENHGAFSNLIVSNKTNLWTTGLSTEIIWRGRKHKDLKHAFKLFYGGTPGLAKSFKEIGQNDVWGNRTISSTFFSFNYFFTYKKLLLGYEYSHNVNSALKITCGYRL